MATKASTLRSSTTLVCWTLGNIEWVEAYALEMARFAFWRFDHMRLVSLAGVVGLMLFARAAGAQVGTFIPIQNRTYVALNPLGIPFDIVSGEIESAIAPGVTAGGSASYTDLQNDRYTSFDAKVRFYPGEVVLRGLAFGMSVGSLHYSSPDNGANIRQTITVPTIGILADYNWLLGVGQHFLVGTGLGAKRVLASTDERDRVGIDRAYVTARFLLGYAF